MTDPSEVYPLILRGGRWWLPYGLEADAEGLAGVFRSDCSVVFLWPEGGSFSLWADEDGQEMVRLNHGAWQPLAAVILLPWQEDACRLVQEAIELM